jgi:hypothetical protein
MATRESGDGLGLGQAGEMRGRRGDWPAESLFG